MEESLRAPATLSSRQLTCSCACKEEPTEFHRRLDNHCGLSILMITNNLIEIVQSARGIVGRPRPLETTLARPNSMHLPGTLDCQDIKCPDRPGQIIIQTEHGTHRGTEAMASKFTVLHAWLKQFSKVVHKPPPADNPTAQS